MSRGLVCRLTPALASPALSLSAQSDSAVQESA
jgi:hypothetical protein